MLSRLFPSTRRLASTITSVKVVESISAQACLEINLRQDINEASVTVPLVWLRDHCRSPSNYNHTTNQRKSNMLSIFDEATINDRNAIKFDKDIQKLSIDWKDGHKTEFESADLIKMLVKPPQKDIRDLIHPWTVSTIPELPVLHKSSFSFPEFSRAFVKYGFVCVDGIEKTPEATEMFARYIAPIHDTYYGAFWVFNNNAEAQDRYHEDTAYSSEEIGPHTDGTYFPQSPGIQVFHCLRPADKGGATVLVDAFAAAIKLKQQDPESYRILTTTLIDHHYIEKGDNPLFSWAPTRPVIELNGDGGIGQIRFNPYDRAPLRLALNQGKASGPDEIVAFYKAYQAFSRICHDPSSSININLSPGTVIFINNLRVLHARTAFQGYRQMCGCYLSLDNLMAKARQHIDEETRLQI